MKKPKIIQKLSTVLLILLLSLSVLSLCLTTATAQESSVKQTYAFIGAIPNPVGVNQQVLLHIGITDYLSSTEEGFEGLIVTVERPNGESEELGPFRTDSTGGTGIVYTPTLVGTYKLQTIFPEQTFSMSAWGGLTGDRTFLESESDVLELKVQEEQTSFYPGNSLPNEYWSRPINAQLWEWSTISGNWLWTHRAYNSGCSAPNMYAPYNDGPETSHILWSTPMTTGGLVGGDLGAHSYEDGDAYEGFFRNPIILNGVLYYNKHKEAYPIQEVSAIDLHTGEELWCKTLGDNERLDFGQTLFWDSFNYHGTFDYLYTRTPTYDWTTFALLGETWKAYDPTNGQWIFTMENVPVCPLQTYAEDTQVFGANGEVLRYLVDLTNGWVALWNSTKVVTATAVGSDIGSWGSNVMGSTFDATLGIEWNKTIAEDLSEYADTRAVLAILEDRIIGGTTDEETQAFKSQSMHLWAISTESGTEGEVIFSVDWERPSNDQNMIYRGASLEEGIFIIASKETLVHYAFSVETGELVWSTDDEQMYLNSYDFWGTDPRNVAIIEGKVFSVGFSGTVIAYNAQTGDVVWTYDAVDPYNEILWSNNWPLHILFITDGKIYLGHNEHSPIDPKPRGAPFICLDLDTGEEVWRIDGAFRGHWWGGAAIIGDSIIATYDSYDQQIYAIGKGPSATTVRAPDTTQILGIPILVKGTVMDVSPGTEKYALTARFPNGVPAVSDNSMNEWMKYIYMQFDCPDDVDGVSVTLCAIDPNGNYQDLGITTTDIFGSYSLAFDPQVSGTYQIIATFEGSGAYYGSTATTYVQVASSSVSTPIEPEEPVDTTEPTADVSFIPTEIAIIVGVAVAAVIGVTAYFLLKRK